MNHPDSSKETNENAEPATVSLDTRRVPEERDQGALGGRDRQPQIPSDDRTESEKEEDDRAEEKYWDDQREEGYDAARDYATPKARLVSASRLRAVLSGWSQRIMTRLK